MVVFHLLFDLKEFEFVDWKTPDGPGWKQWRELIVSMFLICVGISLTYSHKNGLNWRRIGKRFLLLALSSGVVTIATMISHPESWVFFGILHFITVASLVSLPLLRLPQLSLILGLLLLIVVSLGWIPSHWPYYALFPNLPQYTVDFVPLFPWLSLVWLGIWLGHRNLIVKDPLKCLPIKAVSVYISKHSLLIYLIHQPILIGMLVIFQQMD